MFKYLCFLGESGKKCCQVYLYQCPTLANLKLIWALPTWVAATCLTETTVSLQAGYPVQGEGGGEKNHFVIQKLSYFTSWRDWQCNLGSCIAVLERALSLKGDAKETSKHFVENLRSGCHQQLWQKVEAGVSHLCSQGAQRPVTHWVKLGTSFKWFHRQDSSFQELAFIRNISFFKKNPNTEEVGEENKGMCTFSHFVYTAISEYYSRIGPWVFSWLSPFKWKALN